ncbi:MAG: hypothetical protein KGH89_08620 [Thaumarchaeota archaeon]|nr:hypothetical protein [Nitrososphaerota archaeon]MDE1867125.1 hypothetical protein [Nitrososphaerota archaeon]
MFVGAATLSILISTVFGADIDKAIRQAPIIIDLMFIPSFLIGLLYGIKMAERVMSPTAPRSPTRRGIIKIFLFIFMMGSIFTSVSFALHGGVHPPQDSIWKEGVLQWTNEFVQANGGLTFLIVSSITMMAAATKRIVGMDGFLSRVFTFVGTYIFFTIIALSLTHNDPTHSQVYLYACYQAGIVGGIFYQINKFATRSNMWEDYMNGYY